jgi:benzoyl-CoA reductase subunit C
MGLSEKDTKPALGPLEELTGLSSRMKNPYIRDWKQNGGVVFGYMCTYIPEEILFSSKGRILPIRAGAAGCRNTDEADVYLHKFICSYARSLLQLGLTGEYDFLDGLVFMNGCDQLRRVFEIWRDKAPTRFLGMVAVPHAIEGAGRFEWYVEELRRLSEQISSTYAFISSDDDLKKSIQIYNRYRELMGEVYRLRTRVHPPLTGTEAMGLSNAAFTIPKEIFNEKLAQVLQELTNRKGIESYRARIMVAGSYMDDSHLIRLIESTGALVVTDNLCFGRRHIEGMVDESEDPFTAIAKRYFYHNPCPRMMQSYKERLAFTTRVAKEAQVDGVIFTKIPFCDNHGVESQMEAADLEKIGLPSLMLERDYISTDEGRLKTRIQAFLEKLGK